MATRPPRKVRTRTCQQCGRYHYGKYVTWHESHRSLELCRDCCEAMWSREDVEARYQLELLEATWRLTPWQTGAGLGEDGEPIAP
jgi:hypothetical protein